jgi:hypothetical protein
MMVTEGMCARCWRVAKLCLGQLELFSPRPTGARQPGAAALKRCGCLTGTLSAAMPVPLALLSLGAGIVALALAALVDSLILSGRLRRQRALRDLAALT